MLTVPHMVTGAALGSLIGEVPGQNFFAFAVGVGSHYVLDAVPHWERLFGAKGSDFSTATPLRQWPRSFLYQALGDVVLAFLTVAFCLYWEGSLTVFWQSPLFWGALGGFSPDLIDNVPGLNNVLGRFGWVRAERKFHQDNHISDQIQQRLPKYVGLVTQLVVVAAGLFVALYLPALMGAK